MVQPLPESGHSGGSVRRADGADVECSENKLRKRRIFQTDHRFLRDTGIVCGGCREVPLGRGDDL